MGGVLDKAEIEIACTKCGRKSKKSIGWLNSNRSFPCTCGAKVTIDAGQFRRGVAKVEEAIRKLGM